MKVLVVEDSKFQRELLAKVFQELGFEVITAEDGRRGVEEYEDENPDVIFTDLLMPELDGIGMIKELKHLGCTLPIYVLTADIQAPIKQECLDLGVQDFFNKPITKQFKERMNSLFKKAS